jgi:hypothetical protein
VTDKERFDAGLALFVALHERGREEADIVLHELVHLVLGTTCGCEDEDDEGGPVMVMEPDTTTIH